MCPNGYDVFDQLGQQVKSSSSVAQVNGGSGSAVSRSVPVDHGELLVRCHGNPSAEVVGPPVRTCLNTNDCDVARGDRCDYKPDEHRGVCVPRDSK
jgi:hypothetical protein